MRRSFSVAVLALVACAAEPRVEKPAAAPVGPEPYPAECVEPVARARALGRALFEDDLVSAWGTDAAMAAGLEREAGLKTWITTRDTNGWEVHFLAERDGRLVEPLKVGFPAQPSLSTAKVTRSDPPKEPHPDVRFMYEAYRTAAEPPHRVCSPRYNHVVLPAARIGGDGWLIYLLASSTEPGALVVGGHVRRMVSADGGKVLEDAEMSKDCMTLREKDVPPDSKVKASVVSNLLWPCPTEVHVWLSLLSRKDLYVVNKTGLWEIDGTKVTYLGEAK
ncbi:MAG: hypothetical protein QM704_05125 [Anaeromyxobacteraceae bacterium]